MVIPISRNYFGRSVRILLNSIEKHGVQRLADIPKIRRGIGSSVFEEGVYGTWQSSSTYTLGYASKSHGSPIEMLAQKRNLDITLRVNEPVPGYKKIMVDDAGNIMQSRRFTSRNRMGIIKAELRRLLSEDGAN